jgi:hypothetical protein
MKCYRVNVIFLSIGYKTNNYYFTLCPLSEIRFFIHDLVEIDITSVTK